MPLSLLVTAALQEAGASLAAQRAAEPQQQQPEAEPDSEEPKEEAEKPEAKYEPPGVCLRGLGRAGRVGMCGVWSGSD